jgi:hypothetical protein
MGLLTKLAAAATIVGGAAAVVTLFYHPGSAPQKGEMKRVVTALDVSLGDSAKSRRGLAEIIKEVNHCRRWPLTAASQVDGITDDRLQQEATLAKIGRAVNDSAAQDLLDGYTGVLALSEKADKMYAAWLASWNAGYLKIKRGGCHIPRSGFLWNRFQGANGSASGAKRKFLVRYSVQASKYGASGWEETQI